MKTALTLALLLILSTGGHAQTGLVVTASADQLMLSWQDNSSLETGFLIERSAPGDVCEFTSVATVAADVVTWIDTPLAPGVRWCYRVRAVNATETSLPSNVACGTVAEAPPPPTSASIIVTRTPAMTGPYAVSIDVYTCTRIQGGTPSVRINQGATLLGSAVLANPNANPPIGVPFTLTCTMTPSTVTVAIDGVVKLTVQR